jgi:hypothetical protein
MKHPLMITAQETQRTEGVGIAQVVLVYQGAQLLLLGSKLVLQAGQLFLALLLLVRTVIGTLVWLNQVVLALQHQVLRFERLLGTTVTWTLHPVTLQDVETEVNTCRGLEQ